MVNKWMIMAAAILIAGCDNESKNKKTEDAKAVAQPAVISATYNVDPAQSKLSWKGQKITKTVHMGTVDIQSGQLSFEGDSLVAGNFVADMKSIKNVDLTDPKDNDKLVGHLKSGDFFHVDSFPTARFEITGVEKKAGDNGTTHLISGNLTIKGQTRNVSFPATVTKQEDNVTASAVFEIDRNDWGIVWGGTKETNKGVKKMLGDNIIRDMIELDVKLVANK